MKPGRIAAFAAAAFLCGWVASASTAKTIPVCKAGQRSTKAHPCLKKTTTPVVRAALKWCPIVGATGNLGGNGATRAGGVAQTDGATGGITIDCTFLADGLKIQIPGHTVATATPTLPGDTCTPAGDTITCKLNEAQQRQGIAIAGSWQNAVSWKLTPSDPASNDATNGSCGLAVVMTVTNAGSSVYTKNAVTACEFSSGDLLR